MFYQMILLQASQLGSFVLMVLVGGTLIVGLPALTALFKKLFHKKVSRERLETRPFFYKTASTAVSLSLSLCILAGLLAAVLWIFG